MGLRTMKDEERGGYCDFNHDLFTHCLVPTIHSLGLTCCVPSM